MSAVTIDNLRGSRHDSKRELIGQGIGNIIASFFGALYSAGSIPRSIANYRAGGRQRISGALCSILILLIFLTIAPLIGKIPLAVFAAIIIAVGINLFDASTFRLIAALQRPGRLRKDVSMSLLVNLGVAAITVCVNLITAVIIGMAVSTAYFIVKMGTSVIRRQYSAERASSNKVRGSKQTRYLRESGRQISVFELQGPIFFGSADRLAYHLETQTADVAYCILDMKQVTEIDSTGANILTRLDKNFRKKNKRLLISYLSTDHFLWDFLSLNGVTREISKEQFFRDTDEALEWAEDHLLAKLCPAEADEPYDLKDLDITKGFSSDELETLKRFLIIKTFKKGDLVIQEEDKGRDLFILTRGTVSVKMQLPQSHHGKRLFTFSAGAVFGEMALLDGKPRSANVWVEDDAETYCLSYENFIKMQREEYQIAMKILKNLALVLSNRLRVRSDEIKMLVDD